MSGVWTNNWRGLKNLMLLGCYKDGLTTMRTPGGNAPISNQTDNETVGGVSPFTAYNYSFGGYIRFGTGTGTAAATDTTLAAPTPNTFSIVTYQNGACTYDVENGSASRVIKCTIQNSSQSDNITITEFGLFSYVLRGTSAHNAVMVYHEFLSTPVTLVPQQTAVLELSLSMTLSDPL